MRISREQMFMEMAGVVAKRSTCFRANVGAVVVLDNRVISIGYNGAPKDAPHCAGNECPGRFGCRETIHAEVNALDHVPAGSLLSSGRRPDLYVTHSPCMGCAEHIAWKIDRLFFGSRYTSGGTPSHEDPLDFLGKSGVRVYQVTPAGYTVDWSTKQVFGV